jgi:hypothetical protein
MGVRPPPQSPLPDVACGLGDGLRSDVVTWNGDSYALVCALGVAYDD